MTEPAKTWSGLVVQAMRDCAMAVRTDTTSWTGRELLGRASGAARHLRELTRAHTAVPALFTASPTAFAYIVGGAEVMRPLAPLGPRYTAHELGPCVERLHAEVLLTEPAHLEVAEAIAARGDVEVVVVDGPPPVDEVERTPPPADATAFVLHTSGTTGSPKAVAYRQRPLARRSRVNAALCRLETGSVYATASPLHHIAGLGNHAVALAAGATTVPVGRFSVDSWSRLAPLGVTHALTVPTMIESLLDAKALALPTLRVMQYGASPIHPETLQRTLATLPDVELVNIFGQTEGSPITCLTREDHRRMISEGRVDLLESVGRAAPGVEVWIEEPDDQGVGEVCARADHFFATGDGGVLHTGDLGRLDECGYLFLAGRRGDRIVRGGENVYPVEVEQTIETHPGVREAAVVGLDDRRWGETVCAFVVAVDPGHPPSTEVLRSHTRAQLAGFKVPTEWLFVEELPRNPSGKVLRRRLRERAR